MKTRTNPGLQPLCLFQNPVAADVSPRHCPDFAPAPASGCEVLKAALLCFTLAWAFTGAAQTEKPSAAIPFAEIGAKATADYQGDALGISATADGARLRCGFQKLEGRVTPEGLWLESTAPSDGGRLRLVAAYVSRDQGGDEAAPFLWAGFGDFNLPSQSLEPGRSGASAERRHSLATQFAALCRDAATGRLADSGTVEVADKLVRYVRSGVTEEYSVSVDGVRQDFVITERPIGDGDLRVELALTGARAEAMAYGAKLKLEGSSRTLAYSRLRATDATGRELPARMEVTGRAGSPLPAGLDAETGGAHGVARPTLAICVDDADAVYPVRIDPTFSDEDWISMGGLPGANGIVHAATVDGSGNLYIGGEFTVVGNVLANGVAKWNGSTWSPLGSGVGGAYPYVYALAVSGTNLYAGGSFTNAGGTVANRVARWDGSSWWPLGLGLNGSVSALAVSGSDLYVGGRFTAAGGKVSAYLARANLGPPGGLIQNLGVNGGTVALDCLGLPGTAFTVQRATDVMFTADLTTLLTTNAPSPNGQFRCTDSNPPSTTAFYRLLKQ